MTAIYCDFDERYDSPRVVWGTNPTTELIYIAASADLDQIYATALQTTPDYVIHPTGEKLWRGQIACSPIHDSHYEVIVRYERITQDQIAPATGGSTFSFETGGGTSHITNSLETIAAYAPPGLTAPDFKGAIGVTDDAVEGADITTPVYQFAETHYIADASVTDQYKGSLFALTGRTNDDAWRGFAAGEVLFLGATGTRRTADDWEITFRFAASPNVTGMTIGEITNITKGGWEYLWIRYQSTIDGTANAVVKRPRAVYIERVYYSGDFSGLGIG
jgi:hypothetical protein